MKSKKKWIIILAIIIVVLILVILYLLFGMKKSFTVTFNADDGTLISSVKVLDGEAVVLPEVPSKEGYSFVGWIDTNNNIVTKGTKFIEDTVLTAKWIDNSLETVNVTFDTDGGMDIGSITMEKNKKILLPVKPAKDGYVFMGWLNETGNIISSDMLITSDIKLKAYWVSKDAKTVTITFDTDGGNGAHSIVVENGKIIVLPVNPTKDGFVFDKWVDESGNTVTKDTVVNANMKLKALWKEPFTCPDGCTPTGDGSKCTKEVTSNMVSTSTCPDGYKMSNGKCMGTRYYADNGANGWVCKDSSHYMYTEEDGVGGAFMWCVPVASTIKTQKCPDGYTKDGSTCKKTETINCTDNR